MAENKLYDLLRIGLTEGEAKVYMALLELGPSTVGPIVKKARVAYSNVYDILNRLVEKGVVSFVVKSKTKYFQAVSPSNLYEYLDKQEKEIEKQKDALKAVLPGLLKLQQMKPELEAEVFVGKKGLRTAYERLLGGGKDEDLFFYIHEPEYAEKADSFYFSITELFKKVISIRGISNEFGRQSDFNKNTQYIKFRYVGYPIPGNMEVCGDRTLIISWKEPVIGVLIHSKSIADNFRSYFEAVWKVAKE